MKTPKETFELLSKLLSEQQTLNTVEKTLLEDLFSFVKKDIVTVLKKVSFPQKTKMVDEMGKILERAEILVQFPQLIGKTTIGILGTNGLDRRVLDFVAKSKLPKMNNNIPAVLYASDLLNKIHTVNLLDNQLPLSEQAFMNVNKELHRKSIDIRQFLSAYSISASIPYKAISYIHFPFYSLKSMEYYQNLLNLTDCVLIPTDERGIWKQTMEFFSKSNPNKPIHIVTDGQNKEQVEEIVHHFNTSMGSVETSVIIHQLDNNFEQWLASMNRNRNNVSFEESFLCLYSNFYLYQHKYISRLKETVEGMNHDLVKVDNEDTQLGLRKLKQEQSDLLKEARNILQEFKASFDHLMEKVNQFEHSLYKSSDIPYNTWFTETFPYQLEHEEEVSKLILNFLKCNEYAVTRKYMEKLERVSYSHSYIFEMYKRLEAGQQPLTKQLELLAKEKSDQYLVGMTKIRFGEQIGLPRGHVVKLAAQFAESLESEEYYAVAVDYEKCGDWEKAKHYFLKALEEGAFHAGNDVLRFLDSKKINELEHLANALIPEANYRFGMYCLENSRYAKGITALKIAAVYEHIPAIRKLADLEFINAIKNKKSSKERAEKAMNIAMELYRYLLYKNPNDITAIENLGSIYYWKEDFRAAREFLEKGKSSEALFLCGKIYQYGNGVSQNLPKAKDYFSQAAQKGHQRAKVEYEKVCGWIASSQKKENYNSGRSYSTSSSSSYSGSSKGCFLTTATCQALGKEDNCKEILAFKHYRDEHLIKDPDGAPLIREYYKIAPEIIRKIESESNFNETYRQLYDCYIAIGYTFLLQNDYAKAKATYIAMVEFLCQRYQIKINPLLKD